MANKIIVCQLGARHRYLIPKVICDSGMLYRLYTDSTAYSFMGKLSKVLCSLFSMPRAVQRLAKRKPLLPLDKIYSTDKFFFAEQWISLLKKDAVSAMFHYYDGIGKQCVKWGIGEADCIYNMHIENVEFLRYAKSKGLKVVIDIYEVPTAFRNLIAELDGHPEYDCLLYRKEQYLAHDAVIVKYMDEVLQLADYYTIPSQFVVKSMAEFANFDPNKVLYLPYASSITVEKYAYKPQNHRLIWVGNDAVRKGLVYCAKAASILKEKYKDLDFRIIGVVPEELKNSHNFSDLNFLGVLDKSQLQEEYRSAEAYVFPTLYEGFAGTVIEAASCGCPIITTECAGTDVEEFPAIYIPTKDVEAIVEAVIRIFENRELRNDLSKRVYEYSANLSPDTYKTKLIEYLKKI